MTPFLCNRDNCWRHSQWCKKIDDIYYTETLVTHKNQNLVKKINKDTFLMKSINGLEWQISYVPERLIIKKTEL